MSPSYFKKYFNTFLNALTICLIIFIAQSTKNSILYDGQCLKRYIFNIPSNKDPTPNKERFGNVLIDYFLNDFN